MKIVSLVTFRLAPVALPVTPPTKPAPAPVRPAPARPAPAPKPDRKQPTPSHVPEPGVPEGPTPKIPGHCPHTK